MRQRVVPDEETEKFSWWELVRSYVYLLDKRKKIFLLYLGVLFVVQFYQIVPPLILGKIVDFFTGYQKSQGITPFYFYSIILGLSLSVVAFIRLYLKKKISNLKSDIRYDIRVKGYERLVGLSYLETTKETSGEKAQKISNGTSAFSDLTNLVSNELIANTTSIIGVLFIFLFLKFEYILFLLIYFLGFTAILKFFYSKIKKLNFEYSKAMEKSTGSYMEGLSNILTIKSQGANKSYGKRIASREELKRRYEYKIMAVGNKQWTVFQIFNGLCVALFLLLVGKNVADSTISLGSIVMFYGYLQQITGSAGQILGNYQDLISYKTLLARMMPIFNSEDSYKEGTKTFPKVWDKLILSNASFDYPSTKVKTGLRDINLTISNGEKIGIVGRSGGGKSTLAKLLIGLIRLDRGEYKIDKNKFNDIKHESVLKHINLILQDTEMFNMSLKENITLMRKISPKVLNKAIDVSQLSKVVEKLPERLDTLIGEKGYHLSGGERQRVGIARVVCRHPQILILDEATSSLDSRTEANIQRGLQKNLKDKTMIIIAHRVSTLKDVDRIYVIDQGRIVEEGKYQDLINNSKSTFYEIYSLQQKRDYQLLNQL